MSQDERLERARQRYDHSVFTGDDGGLDAADLELDGVEADLALARGRVIHGRFLDERVEDPSERALFERALELYRALGDQRGEAEALFWLGTYRQVVLGEYDASVRDLERSVELARLVDDRLTMSYALRHLGIADHVAGRLDLAHAHLEESTGLRREIGFLPGVAANLVGLVYVALAEGRVDDARSLAAEAASLAEQSGAHRILAQVEEAQASIDT